MSDTASVPVLPHGVFSLTNQTRLEYYSRLVSQAISGVKNIRFSFNAFAAESCAVAKAKNVINGFAKLKQGWDGYDAVPIDPSVCSKAAQLFDASIAYGACDLASLPEAFPTGRNTVQLEFSSPKGCVEVEVYSDCIKIFRQGDAEGPDGDGEAFPLNLFSDFASVMRIRELIGR